MKNILVFFICAYLLSLAPSLAQPAGKNEFLPSVWKEGNGLRAEYFNGSNFQEKVFERIEEEINFSYRTLSPAPGVDPENYSIRWTGSLYAPVTGTYNFIIRVDDGVRLWVNDVKILDKWMLQRATTYSSLLELKGGEFYNLKIEYFNGPTYSYMQLMWEPPPEDNSAALFGLREEQAQKTIPKKYLYGHIPEKKREPPGPTIEEAPAMAGRKNNLPAMTEEKAEEKSPSPGRAPDAEELFENLKPGAVVAFKNVLFEQGKYILLEGSYTELDKLLRTMLRYPGLRIRIDGHTDNVGDPNLNQSLSFFRAKVVETYLVENGIDAARIKVNGLGSSRPLADNTTEEGRAKNRRVEFVVE